MRSISCYCLQPLSYSRHFRNRYLYFGMLSSALKRPLQNCGGGVIWHGLSLDMTMAGYICALPILLLLFAQWLPSRVWGGISRLWLYIAALIVAITFAVNLELYGYWGFPLDGSIFQFLATPKQAMASVTPMQVLTQSAVAIVYFVLFVALINQIHKIAVWQQHNKWGRKIIYSLLLLLLAGVDFLAIRGGVTTAVANVSKAYFSDKIILNHAAVNPTFSLLSSIGESGDLERYDTLDPQQSLELFAQIIPDPSLPPQQRLICSPRPNIVLILAESFGRSTIDEVVGGIAVAPNMQRYKREGVWFENLIASSFRTDRGILATLSGFCAQPTMSLMKDAQRASRLPSIAGSLREQGYTTAYIHGGDLNFTNMASYLYATGFEQLVALKDLHFDAPTSKWGYADDVMADYFIEFIRQKSLNPQPYFVAWQSLSSHEPFDVPTDKFDDPMLNSMYFADSSIARIVEAVRASEAWNNTLIIIIADHAYNYPYGISASSVARHRIPMLWLGGVIKEPLTVDHYCSQSDLAATLLAQLDIDHSRYPLSRDIFAADSHKFGYYTFNNGFGVVENNGATIYDCTQNKVISENSSDLQLLLGKVLLQNTYNIIKQL